jgi:hypothetical protein
MAMLVDPVFWFNFPSQCKTSTAYQAGEVVAAVAAPLEAPVAVEVAVAAVLQAERQVEVAPVKQMVEQEVLAL